MMMKMIDEGGIPALIDNIRTADDDNPKGYYEFEPVKKTKTDASWPQDAPGKVVKMVYRLLYDLPNSHRYRVLFMRELDEVIKSQDVMLERLGKKTTSSPEDAAKVREIFESELKRFYDWEADQQHITMMDVNYNELLSDPQPWVKKINAFLDSNLNTEAMLGVVDPKLYRQRAQ